MSNKMTPCEKFGYKVGDKFEVLTDDDGFEIGSIVELWRDDDSICPLFRGKGGGGEYLEMYLNACQPENGVGVLDVKKVDETKKLTPAKQALADAIHQNGGWADGAEWCAISSADMKGSFWNAKENWLSRENGIWCGYGYMYGRCFSVDRLPVNHHQTILSRDEYFTAYPEQKVEVRNETQNKVEVEMRSESELTIKVSDWHKNGELPPVGEVCGAYIDYPPQWIETEIVAHKDGFAIGWCKSVMKGCHGDKAHEFRPLSTERDKAIDEMVCEFIDHHGDPKVGERYLVVAAKLYDAVYRKEVK